MLLRTGVPSHVCWVVLTKRSWPKRDRGTDLQIPRCRILERHTVRPPYNGFVYSDIRPTALKSC